MCIRDSAKSMIYDFAQISISLQIKIRIRLDPPSEEFSEVEKMPVCEYITNFPEHEITDGDVRRSRQRKVAIAKAYNRTERLRTTDFEMSELAHSRVRPIQIVNAECVQTP